MSPKARDPESFIPLKHSHYRVLLALATGELHGYAIMNSLATMTDGQEKLLPGTLYAALGRMVEDGLVEERDPPADETSGGPKRRYYRCTELGRAVARAESVRLSRLLEIAAAHDLLPGGTG